MKKLLVAGLLLVLSACAGVGHVASPDEQVAKMTCNTGDTVARLLADDQLNVPQAKVFINKVLTGDAASALLSQTGAPENFADTVVIMSAHAYPGEDGASRMVAVKNGCVVGSIFLDNGELAKLLGVDVKDLVK